MKTDNFFIHDEELKQCATQIYTRQPLLITTTTSIIKTD